MALISLRKTASGNVEILQDGRRVSTASQSAAEGIARAMGGTFIGYQDPATFKQEAVPTEKPKEEPFRALPSVLQGLENGAKKNPAGTLKSFPQANRERTERGHAPLTKPEYDNAVAQYGGLSDRQKEIAATTQTQEDADIEAILAKTTLSEDEKQFARVYFTLSTAKDEQLANNLLGALELGKQFANPIFAQKVRLAKDELSRGFVTLEQDLAFNEQKLRTQLSDLQQDISTRQETLSIDERQQFAQFERSQRAKLETTREQLARTGFTFSTRAAEQEKILAEEKGELRESLERGFATKRQELERTQIRTERDVQSEIERLRRTAGEAATGELRQREEQLGIGGLPQLFAGAPTIQQILQQRGFATLGIEKGTLEQQRLAGVAAPFSSFVF